MTELKFIKTFGLVLIGTGLLVMLLTIITITHNPEIMLNAINAYKVGLFSGGAIGLSLSGGFLRLYSAPNE